MAKFTKYQLETAIKVMMSSQIVSRWVESEARFLGVDLGTPEGKLFSERKRRYVAERLVR